MCVRHKTAVTGDRTRAGMFMRHKTPVPDDGENERPKS
jgi:hypothetical protein